MLICTGKSGHNTYHYQKTDLPSLLDMQNTKVTVACAGCSSGRLIPGHSWEAISPQMLLLSTSDKLFRWQMTVDESPWVPPWDPSQGKRMSVSMNCKRISGYRWACPSLRIPTSNNLGCVGLTVPHLFP